MGIKAKPVVQQQHVYATVSPRHKQVYVSGISHKHRNREFLLRVTAQLLQFLHQLVAQVLQCLAGELLKCQAFPVSDPDLLRCETTPLDGMWVILQTRVPFGVLYSLHLYIEYIYSTRHSSLENYPSYVNLRP